MTWQHSFLHTHTHTHLQEAMAGNIIPAIATTNAVIAGLIVMEALKVLAGEPDRCKTVSQSFTFFFPRNHCIVELDT